MKIYYLECLKGICVDVCIAWCLEKCTGKGQNGKGFDGSKLFSVAKMKAHSRDTERFHNTKLVDDKMAGDKLFPLRANIGNCIKTVCAKVSRRQGSECKELLEKEHRARNCI